jgi:hypothetical protein
MRLPPSRHREEIFRLIDQRYGRANVHNNFL